MTGFQRDLTPERQRYETAKRNYKEDSYGFEYSMENAPERKERRVAADAYISALEGELFKAREALSAIEGIDTLRLANDDYGLREAGEAIDPQNFRCFRLVYACKWIAGHALGILYDVTWENEPTHKHKRRAASDANTVTP